MRIYTQEERLQLVTEDRRSLHRIPEFGYDLPKTREYIGRILKDLNPDLLEPCDEGIKAVFCAEHAEKGAIAFRADMDALLTLERSGLPFASEHPGVSHACGHDGHMAALLMLARIVAGRREELNRDVVLLFQPAEENFGGAKRMIDAGAMVNPTVTEVYGMHIMPTLPAGTIGCCVGPMMAAVETIEIEITGKSAHGATPQKGCDALMAMSHFVLNVQAAMERRIGPLEPAIFSVGSAEAGSIHNIIADHALLKGNLRTYDAGVTQRAMKVIKDALAAADIMYGTRSELTCLQSYPAVINHEECVERIRAIAHDDYQTLEPVTISEDFSEFELLAPGAFFFCGCADETHRELLHSEVFNFDESTLLTGVRVYEQLIFGGAGGVQ